MASNENEQGQTLPVEDVNKTERKFSQYVPFLYRFCLSTLSRRGDQSRMLVIVPESSQFQDDGYRRTPSMH